MKRGILVGVGTVVGVALWSMALAGGNVARCSTTDDGVYECEFRFTAKNGSFKISAPEKPTYMLNIVEPGVAYGFINLGAKNIALPGQYLRSDEDRACWRNDATQTEICAW